MRPRNPTVNDSFNQRRHRPDYLLVLLSSILLVIGLVVVYAISPGLESQAGVGEGYYIVKQLVAIVLGIAAFLIMSRIPISLIKRFMWPLVAVAVVTVAAVPVFGEEVNGARRWLQVGGLSFQPVELIKFALIIWLAGFLAKKLRDRSLNDFKRTIRPLLVVLALTALVVAKMQSDLGSAGVIVVIMGVMAFVAGLDFKKIAVIGAITLVGTALLIISSPYRTQRFMTYINPGGDCLDSGYQTCQALIAVGSGGLAGRGLGNSGQAFGYLPEAANDSIFAIMSEKFGFLGMSVVLFLFMGLFARLKKILEHAPDEYTRLLVTGILAWLSTQAIINIGAMIGVLPLKGITLPFISYGGTSLVFVTAAIGLVFNISRYTTYSISADGERSRRESATDWRGNRRPYYAANIRRS